MVSPDVVRTGELLGLSPGLDGPSRGLPSVQKLDRAKAILDEIPEEAFAGFWHEFAANYLPSFQKGILKISFDSLSVQEMVTVSRYLILFQATHRTSLGRRFVREHGEAEVALYLFLLETTLKFTVEQVKEDKFGTCLFPFLLSILDQSLAYLTVYYRGNSVPVPSLNLNQQSTLRRLTRACMESEAQSAPTFVSRDELDDLPRAVCDLWRLDLQAHRKEDDFPLLSWYSCDWARDESLKGQQATCAQLEDGEEMMACGQCLAVRYCSRDHQRLHWKKHKEFCFSSSW